MTRAREGKLEKLAQAGRLFGAERWQQRYVMVDGNAFCYWHDQADKEAGNMPSKDQVYSLRGYEVMINPEDPTWRFSLVPATKIHMGAHDGLEWHFRAENELERIAWVEVFLAGCLAADDYDDDIDTRSFLPNNVSSRHASL